ncbi:PRTRC system protein C [Cupriavidus basilensis]|uniref:PRTRC system protein C n=1 Tax=Cupriavidus basilensis TaxID=68895 RepID=UPI0007513136|nr:PRTRC system protein C [Cupriavidus basilensis]
MAIEVKKLTREFVYNGVKLPDPGADFSPDQVRDMYTAQYPELNTAAVEGVVVEGDVGRYEFVRAAGAKG